MWKEVQKGKKMERFLGGAKKTTSQVDISNNGIQLKVEYSTGPLIRNSFVRN